MSKGGAETAQSEAQPYAAVLVGGQQAAFNLNAVTQGEATSWELALQRVSRALLAEGDTCPVSEARKFLARNDPDMA